MWKTYSSLDLYIDDISKLLIVSHRCPETKDSRIVIFNVSFFNDSFFAGYQPSDLSSNRTNLGSQIFEYLGQVGFSLKAPFRNKHISGCDPIVNLELSHTITAEIADLAVLRAL